MNYDVIRKYILDLGEDRLVYRIVCLQDTIREKVDNTLYEIVLQNETISEKDRLEIINQLTFAISIETDRFSSILCSTLTRYTKDELTDEIISKIISQIITNFKEVVFLIKDKVNVLSGLKKPPHQKVKCSFYNEIINLKPSDFEKYCSKEKVREKISDIRNKLFKCNNLPDIISIPKFKKEECSESRCQFVDKLQKKATEELWRKTYMTTWFTLYRYDDEEVDDVLFFVKNQTVIQKEIITIIYSDKTLKQKQKTFEKLWLTQFITLITHFKKNYIKNLKLENPTIREDVWFDIENHLSVKFNNINKLKITKDQPLRFHK